MKTLIVGNGGRESSIAWKLSQESSLNAVMRHANPTIIEHVIKSGGTYVIGDTNDKNLIASFAKKNKIDLAFITTDASLEAGVVDSLIKAGIVTVGPTRRGAEIEWNKAFAMSLIEEILPEYTPRYWIIKDRISLDQTFTKIVRENIPIVVKPQGLTGGKGVKVMGEHLADFSDAKKYAWSLINEKTGSHESVIIEEKLSGPEFTLQVLTDGENFVEPPATYDYPYRYDLDKGPGTGGMGSFSDAKLPLPFMTNHDYKECIKVVKTTLMALKRKKLHYSGVLNAGFFLTPEGIRIMEFNARFGDPECMNIMTLLDSSLLNILQKIAARSLTSQDIFFKPLASVVKYLVSPEYAVKEGKERNFSMDVASIQKRGINVFFSSAVSTGGIGQYRSVGNSRVVALACTAKTIPEAAKKIDRAIANCVKDPLEYRSDIGSIGEIKRLTFTSNKKG